jgi:hypothetical protein
MNLRPNLMAWRFLLFSQLQLRCIEKNLSYNPFTTSKISVAKLLTISSARLAVKFDLLHFFFGVKFILAKETAVQGAHPIPMPWQA